MILTDRPVAITGASSGIGAATALACARAGMHVAIMARRSDRLDAVATKIRREVPAARVVTFTGSVDSDDDAAAFVAHAERLLGPLYAVFANAGYGIEAPAHAMPRDDVRSMLETNFYGSLRLASAVVAGMIERRSGHILFCSSCLSKLGTPYYAAYSASKACQDHFARAMRVELAPMGVAVSSVHPIGTRTEFFETAAAHSPGGTRLLDRGSSRFLQPPERVARAVVRRLQSGRGGEIWTSAAARLGFAAAGALPGLTDALLARALRARQNDNSTKASPTRS